MKTGTLFSAGAWGAMALALASLTVPSVAGAAEPRERSGDYGARSARSEDRGGEDRGDRGRQRGDSPRVHQDNADAGRVPARQPQAPLPTMRSNDAAPRDWAVARARIAAQRDRADNRNAPDAGNRPGGNRGNDSPTPSWKRGDNDNRNGSWSRGDNDRDRDNRDRGNQGRDWQGRDWRNDSRGDHDNRWSNSRGNHDNRNDHDRDDRHDDRRDWGRDHRDWDRSSWRRDNRYDWHNYRENHRSVYRIGRYYAPYHGYSYRRLGIGFSLGSVFYGNRYWISDPWSYRLPAVYGPYRWVRYYDDVLLVNIYTGQVVDVIYDFFW